MIVKRLTALLLFWVLVGTACAKKNDKNEEQSKKDSAPEYKLTLLDELKVKDLPEPSGLAWAASRGTLFAVGDEGHVAELSKEGEILNSGRLGMRDLEGVAYDSEYDELYVLDEALNGLILLDPDSFEIKDEISLGMTAGPFEGLDRDASGRFYLSEQSISKKGSGVLILSRDEEPRLLETGIADQSAILVRDDKIYILSDSDDRLYCLSPEGEILWDCKVKGETQEGLAVDDEGTVYIAQDSGGILKMTLELKEK